MNTTNKDYFTFNVHNSILLIGQTGSGKSELVRSYIQRLEKAFTPEQMQYVIYDLKQCEFVVEGDVGAKKEYLYTKIRTGEPEDMDYLEAIASLAGSRSKEQKPAPMLFIYIEEIDMAVAYTERFHKAVMTINKHAKSANMKIIFSTSRLDRNILTKEFCNSFDLILSGLLPSKEDAEYFEVPYGDELEQYAFYVREN